jgi:signal transduction histidine kinase
MPGTLTHHAGAVLGLLATRLTICGVFRRLRQLRISLAAKCQLLFGAAVVLIIAAALYVPGRRVEQLTEQLNERSARTLAGHAIAQHISGLADRPTVGSPARTATRPTTSPVQAYPPTTSPVAAFAPPTTRPIVDALRFAPPRLILLAREARDAAIIDNESLTSFERWAIRRLRRDQEREWVGGVYETTDGESGYRFAQMVGGCSDCHATAATKPPPAQASATAPASPGLLGVVAVEIPSQVQANQLLLNRIFLLTAWLLSGTLAVIVFYQITTRLILQPVQVLQETAEKVSQGDLNIRSDIHTGDEFQQLSETLNTMLANLKSGSDQLQAANKSLDLRLGQLAQANVALYESNRLKNEFLANVSHELRTPLNSILGFAELLSDIDSLGADSKATRYVQNILNSGRNLLELINDLLDLAKIEAGQMDVRSEPLPLGDLFEGLVSLLKPLSESRQLTITPAVAADVPILQTDPPKLQQVLYNLLSNAIKFSPVGGAIELTAERDGEGVRIAVVDHGPGIEPDMQQLIFEKFRQLDASVTRPHSGTGLGLAISKELVGLLGGSIGVQSIPGQGATFWLQLPAGIAPARHDVRRPTPVA